ncbi:MAG: DUF1992 domain-containing protein [Polyangiaceae bacterium]|nr:DUF1992 domain-containing protein [Polyangiaceae bacterium]
MWKGSHHLVEARIQGAMRSGALDDLPGSGKPLKDDDLAGLTAEERFEALITRSVGGPPEEVRLLREIGELREAKERAGGGEAQRIEEELQKKTMRLCMLFEASGKYVLARMLRGER